MYYITLQRVNCIKKKHLCFVSRAIDRQLTRLGFDSRPNDFHFIFLFSLLLFNTENNLYFSYV